MKKFITLLLCVLLVASTLPMSVFAASDENLALGRPVISEGGRPEYKPDAINDGNINSSWAGQAGYERAYIGVDLGEEYIITEVILHNSMNEAAQYRRGVDIELSNKPDFSVKEVYKAMGVNVGDESPLGEPVRVVITSTKPYRYVRAVKTNATTHIVNELEVYGYQYDPNALHVGKDVMGTKLEGPVTMLSYLKLIDLEKPLEDIFGVNSVMTRAEAVASLVKAFAGDVSFAGWLPFVDVAESTAHYTDIMTAYHMGYITGDEGAEFRPNDYVTTGELFVMTLRAISYQDVAEKVYDHNMSKMLRQAEQLDLVKDTGITDYTAFATRGQMAQIFYNALLAPRFSLYMTSGDYLVYDNESDLLAVNHNKTLTRGIVEETRMSTIDGTQKTGKTTVKIGGQTFADPEGKLDNLLGQQVIVMTDDKNPDTILLAWKTLKNEEVILPANALVSTTDDIEAGRIVVMDAEGDRETYDLEDKFNVVINGVSYPYYSADDLMITNGQLRLLDNDRDGVYEVVFVEVYTLHYLKNAFFDDATVTIIDSEGVRQTFDREQLTIVNAVGEEQAPKRVIANSVVKLYQSVDGVYNKLVLYPDFVAGKLQSMDDAVVAVDKNTYDLSLAYRVAERDIEPVPGENVALFVDENNEVIWIERNLDSIRDGWTIAFSQQYKVGKGLNSDLCFRFFTIDGNWKEVFAAEMVLVDGISTTRSALAELLANDSDKRFTGDVIRYMLNSNGEVRALDTRVDTAAEFDGTDHMTASEEVASGMLWTTRSGAFWSGQKMISLGAQDTPVFILPLVGGETATSATYDSYYRVVKLNSIISSHQQSQRTVYSYMKDEFGYPLFFTSYQSYSAGAGTSTYVTSESAPYLFVDKITTTVNSEGTVMQQISGHGINVNTFSQNVSIMMPFDMQMLETGALYQEHPECFGNTNMINASSYSNDLTAEERELYMGAVTDIGVGDVVRYQYSGNNLYAIERIYDYDNSKVTEPGTQTETNGVWYGSGNNKSAYSIYYRYQLGTLAKVSDKAFTIQTIAGGEETYQTNVFSNLIALDTTGTKAKFKQITSLSQYEGTGVQVLVYSYNGSPSTILVYPEQ